MRTLRDTKLDVPLGSNSPANALFLSSLEPEISYAPGPGICPPVPLLVKSVRCDPERAQSVAIFDCLFVEERFWYAPGPTISPGLPECPPQNQRLTLCGVMEPSVTTCGILIWR